MYIECMARWIEKSRAIAGDISVMVMMRSETPSVLEPPLTL